MTTKLNKIADYWNQRSSGYSLDNQEELLNDQEKWLKLIHTYVPLKKDLKVLDLGCGPGFLSILLSKQGCQVTGIDYSNQMLEEAKHNAKENNVHTDFKKMDVQELTFDDESFDFVITRNVTWNLEKPKQAYQEIYRVLKPGGLFVFDYVFVTEEFYNQMPQSARETIKGRYPTVFWDSLDIFDELGYSKIETVEKSTWSNKNDESTLADLCRRFNTELTFSSFIRYCTK